MDLPEGEAISVSEPGSFPGLADSESVNHRSVLLMTEVARGSHSAFAELVTLHQHAVVGTIAKMLGNPSDAEDLAQQVFLRIWKSAPRYQPTAKFTTWLFTITRNLVFNEVRRRQRKPVSSLDQEEESRERQIVADDGQTPQEAALQRELETAVDQAIASLPEKQRLAVVLRRYEDLPYEQIGEILDLSLSAVKSLLFRARMQLRQELQQYLEDGGKDL
jgi:RNA polymerase sigma-70 factor, ECF subfamily